MRHAEHLERLRGTGSARERHAQLLQHYKSRAHSDADAVRHSWEFVPSPGTSKSTSVEHKLMQSVHSKLDKEFAIADISSAAAKQQVGIGLRWRTAEEVEQAKGEKKCAERSCTCDTALRALELPFEYSEHGQNKRALVKVVLCEECAQLVEHARASEPSRHNIRKRRKKRKRSSEASFHTKSKRAQTD